VWQGIDYLQALRDHGARIAHMHAQDIVMDQARLKVVGVHGRGWWRFVIPGLGQLDWPAISAALKAAGYAGDVALEHEHDAYMGAKWSDGLAIGLQTLRPFVAAF
jgi:sugar phosphate isomerase/epimerase